jgi:hypothetical protein
MNSNKSSEESIRPEVIDILMKQYDLLWANIRHNETVRDHLYNFYLVAFSFLMLGAFHLIKIRQDSLPELSRIILIFPFMVISFTGIITIAIQSRLRMVLNRDIKAADSIRKFLITHYPPMTEAFEVLTEYFQKRQKSRYHRYFNLSRLVIYLVFGTTLFSSGIGTYLVAPNICLICLSLVLNSAVSILAAVLFESKSFYEKKKAMSSTPLY